MLTTQRKKLLLARLAADGQLVAKALAAEHGTSEDTIRRDLRELAADGRLRRVHGGAVPIAPAAGDLRVRETLATADKRALGRHAAALIEPGQVAVLDGGTTALQIARHLPHDLRATIVTHSPNVALEAAACPGVEVLVLGGRLFRHSMVHVGATVIEAAARLRADIYFLGVTGVHPEAGLSTADAEEAAVKRALMRRAATTVVLASAEKLMVASPFVIAPLDAAAQIVVPRTTPDRVARALRAGGATLRKLPG